MKRFACATVAVLGLAARTPAQPNLVVDSGFETGAPALGPRPTDFGRWQGDRVAYVGATGGMSPFEGARMLQFVNAEFVPSGSDGSQYWQNIDLSSYAPLIASGRAVLSASAQFNR